MKRLFPIYRTLCGPGFLESLDTLKEDLPLKIHEFPSGEEILGWTIPKEFIVKESFVEDEHGTRYFDYAKNSYHAFLYGHSMNATMTKNELKKHVYTKPELPDAVPLRGSYYHSRWGISASQNAFNALPDETFRVCVDTELRDGVLRIGDYYLPGESKKEIMLTSYLCHPKGGNDNLSGCVVAVELFKLLSRLPKRRFSYRLVIWPETIGAITYIGKFKERLSRIVGGYVMTCMGDLGPFHYKETIQGGSIFDRTAKYVLKKNDPKFVRIPYSHSIGSDECQFNSVGLRLPFGSIMRTPYARFPQYHTDLDDLSYVNPNGLLESLKVYWETLLLLERNRVYKGKYTVDPFLTKHGIYPFKHGAGQGGVGDDIARAYYELMGRADGLNDLLCISETTGIPFECFDNAVSDFLDQGLIEVVGEE